jgi:hypothetical protein
MEGAPPVANQIDLFMHFLGVSRDGLVARPVEMDKLSSSEKSRLPRLERVFANIIRQCWAWMCQPKG